MAIRTKHLLLCASIAIVTAVAILWSQDNGPRCHGRTLSDWAAIYHETFADHDEQTPAVIAIQQIGTNAIPHAVRWMQEPERFRDFFEEKHNFRSETAVSVFRVLGPEASPAIAELTRLAIESADGDAGRRALVSLLSIGPAAIPAVLTIATNSNSGIRYHAILAIRGFRNPHVALPALLQCLQDDDESIAMAAATVLVRLDFAPEDTLPVLIEMLGSPRPTLRLRAIMKLGQYGETARPAISMLRKCMEDDEPRVRRLAQRALERIAPELQNRHTMPAECIRAIAAR